MTDILIFEAFQVVFVEYDHMVKQVEAAIPNQAFPCAVLSRTAETGLPRLHAEAIRFLDDFVVELWAAIEDQVAVLPP
jgi:hypothetical protein